MKCFRSSSIKIYRCKIILLDETELIQEIKESQKGQDLLDIVFKHLDLLETVYFGLRFIDSKGFSNWLEPNKNAIKQVKDIEPIKLYFGVKFYASDPCKLREECTRYQFFLQIKQDIQQQRLPVTNELATQLLAFIIQSELGDYDPKIHQYGYVNEFCWIENQSIEFENNVCDLHKKLIGQLPASVEMQFLERVKWLDLYGCELHSVMAGDDDHLLHEYFIGLGPHGIIVLKNKLKIANYYWPRIIKIWRKGKIFMIKVIDKNNIDKTYGFEMYDRQLAKRLYESCKNHREFFKLSQSTRMQQQTSLYLMSNNGKKTSLNNDNGIRMINQDYNRPNPSLIRVPSRRFRRRNGIPDGSENIDNKNGQFYEEFNNKQNENIDDCRPMMNSVPMNNARQIICRFNSTPSIPKSNEFNALINPYHPHQHQPNKNECGLFSKSASASPLSVRSAFVARYDYGHMNYISPIKRNHSAVSLQRHQSHRSLNNNNHNHNNNDNDSEISSRYSKQSKSNKMINHNGQPSSSSRSARKKIYYIEPSPRMVEWNETIDKRKIKPIPAAAAIDAHNKHQPMHSAAIVRNVRKYHHRNNKSISDSDDDIIDDDDHHYHQQQQQRRSSNNKSNHNRNSHLPSSTSTTKSSSNLFIVPNEIQKYIYPEPIDPIGYTEAEKKNIQFTKIRTQEHYHQQPNDDYPMAKSKHYQRSSKSDVDYYISDRIMMNKISAQSVVVNNHEYDSLNDSNEYHQSSNNNPNNAPATNQSYYYYSTNNDNNQRNGGHILNNFQSNQAATPRVTFQPTHSTAYYSNNDDYKMSSSKSKTSSSTAIKDDHNGSNGYHQINHHQHPINGGMIDVYIGKSSAANGHNGDHNGYDYDNHNYDITDRNVNYYHSNVHPISSPVQQHLNINGYNGHNYNQHKIKSPNEMSTEL